MGIALARGFVYEFEPLGDDVAVFARERNAVRNRRDCRKVEVFIGAFAVERDADFERDARAAQIVVNITVVKLRVDADTVGENCGQLVVVGYYYLRALLLDILDLVRARNSAVDRYEKLGKVFLENFVDCVLVQSVAVAAFGNIDHGLDAEVLQGVAHYG